MKTVLLGLAVALGAIRARYPSATAAAIVAKLDGAVDDLGPAGREQSFGFGRVNLLQTATE